VGVYIIYNATKNKHYVGQAKRLFFRVNQHFTGHGNGDVYSDYKLGDKFTIVLLSLQDSGYYDLDKLEKDMIKKYHAYTEGYNRTAGNS
jgi:excinuclease UvrABC nuclease subunit